MLAIRKLDEETTPGGGPNSLFHPRPGNVIVFSESDIATFPPVIDLLNQQLGISLVTR